MEGHRQTPKQAPGQAGGRTLRQAQATLGSCAGFAVVDGPSRQAAEQVQRHGAGAATGVVRAGAGKKAGRHGCLSLSGRALLLLPSLPPPLFLSFLSHTLKVFSRLLLPFHSHPNNSSTLLSLVCNDLHVHYIKWYFPNSFNSIYSLIQEEFVE